MRKSAKTLISLALVLTLILSFAACSNSGGSKSFDSVATLQGILDNFKADAQYNEYKSMYPNTTFEEKIDGKSIIISINGDEGVQGSYEYKLDGDYLTYTDKTDSEDYIGIAFFSYLQRAAVKYLDMNGDLVTGYISGCNAFGTENKYYITETDEAAGTTAVKLYIAGKWDMPEIDEMYINEKALEYTSPLSEDDINGVINCGKIRAIYYGSKDEADIVFVEFGERSDLTYKSIMNTVATLQPVGYDTFAKYYNSLKEGEDDGFKVSFALDESFKAEHELEQIEGYDYTVVHFGK